MKIESLPEGRDLILASFIEDVRRPVICDVLSRLRAVNVTPILFKGTSLAYSVYEKPELRPRSDTDLFVRQSELQLVNQAMVDLGFKKVNAVSGSLISYQCAYTKFADSCVGHHFDFHWKICNTQALSSLFDRDELAARAINLTKLDPLALGAGLIDAMIIACVHRVVHHANDERPLWLYDIALLKSKMDSSLFIKFCDLAREKSVASLCAESLKLASAMYPDLAGDVDWDVIQPKTSSDRRREFSARYLNRNRVWLNDIVDDLEALKSFRMGARYLIEHAFPPGQYMREKYGFSNAMALPLLYGLRFVRGARRFFRKARAPSLRHTRPKSRS